MSDNASKFNILGSKIDAQTQIINDKFCQLEMREMQNKIDALRDEKNALQTSAITQQQTQNIVNQIKPCPVPAYLTCNPYGCNGGFTGYGYGYGYGEQKKLSVSEDKTMMTDSTIGLTIATDKTQIVDMVKQSYNDCKVKKESVLKYDEEMRRCEDILKLLNTTPDITTNVTKDFKELDELKAEVKELKQLLQNVTTVRPEIKIETPLI